MKVPVLGFFLLTAICSVAQSPAIQIEESDKALPDSSRFHVPTYALTEGPYHHWFGYYDKWQFDPSGRFVLSNSVNFENRSPQPEDTILVGMIDLQKENEWIELGKSCAWNWQQGCMLQFIPGSDSLVIWNDRLGDQYVSHIVNIFTRQQRTLPFPIYTLNPNGKTALSLDFSRLNDTRPGYGYAGPSDQYSDVNAPDKSGIFVCDLQTGEKKLIVSLADIVKRGAPESQDKSLTYDFYNYKSWFNHLLCNTDGSRFIFLHRWKSPSKGAVGRFGTLMYTANMDGSDVRLIDPSGFTSHFIWRDPHHILAWTQDESHGPAFYLFEDKEGKSPDIIGQDVMKHNGHCTYLPGNEWILNDTYPDGKRQQHVYLYHIASQKRFPLGDFYLDPTYKGEWRVDTHPRFNHQGTQVVIDCPVNDQGRQLLLLDIADIVNSQTVD